MTTAINAVTEAARDDRTLKLPKTAEGLALDVTLFETYEQANQAIGVSVTFQHHEKSDRVRLASFAETGGRMFEAR